MRRRVVGRGFEGFELPQSRGWRPSADDMDLLQGQELPRRRLVSQAPPRSEGPDAFGQPFAMGGLLDRPDGQNIGRSLEFTLGSKASALNIINLTCDDRDAKVVSVTLDWEYVNYQAGIDRVLFLTAYVTWGAGGVQYAAEIDFAQGQVFQLSCSFLRIDVNGTGTGNVKVSAQIGYGAIGDKRAQKTQLVGAVAMGVAHVGVLVPKFATSVQVQRAPSTANLTIQFQDRLSNTITEYQIGNGPGSGTEIYRIPQGSYRIALVNGLGAAITAMRFVFELNL